MNKVDLGGHFEVAVRLAEQVMQAAQSLLAKRRVECAKASFDDNATWHDVPRSVASDVANRRVTLHAVLLEPFDHSVQPLDEKRLRGKHVSATAHHAAVSTWSREADLERIGSCPHQTRLRDHRPRLQETRHVKSDD